MVMALQDAIENYLTGFLQDANQCAIHANVLPSCQRTSNWPTISVEIMSTIGSVLVSVVVGCVEGDRYEDSGE